MSWKEREPLSSSFALLISNWPALCSLAAWARALGHKVEGALAKVLDDAARGLLGRLRVVDLKPLVRIERSGREIDDNWLQT